MGITVQAEEEDDNAEGIDEKDKAEPVDVKVPNK